MAIVQEAFDIPADIMTKILTGQYKRIGGVVRCAVGKNRGQIIKHLKPIDLQVTESAQGIGVKLLKFAKNNKKALIVVGVVAGVTTVGASIYHRVKNKESEAVTKFRSSLKAYISAIGTGNLDMEVINNMMNSLGVLKKHKDYKKISIQFSTEELDMLVNKIYEYTMKLAKDNSVELTEEEQGASGSVVINLQKYLNIQKRIFETVA